MRARVPYVVLFAFLAVTFAGCVEETAIEPDVPVVRVQFAEPDKAFDLLAPDVAVPMTSATVSTGAEPSIQVARDGHAIYIGDHQGGYRSIDGGQTWIRMSTPFLPGVAVDGWDFAEDADGVLYATTTNGNFIQVVRSTNDGLSWDLVTRFLPTVLGGIPDRPWIDARGSGDVILVYNDSGQGTRCLRSYDGGLSWVDRHLLAGAPIAGGVTFDADGHAHWSNKNGVLYRTGAGNAGLPITCVNGFRSVQAAQSLNGAMIQSQIGAEDGRAYTALPTEDNDANKIVAWDFNTETPKEFVFGLPELKSNTFNTIDVRDGRIYSAWYASEDDGDFNNAAFQGWWDVYLAVIDDFWTATPSVQIFKVAEDNHKGNFCFGGVGCDIGGGLDRDLLDYFSIDVDADGRVHIAYGHDGAGTSATVRYVGLTPP